MPREWEDNDRPERIPPWMAFFTLVGCALWLWGILWLVERL